MKPHSFQKKETAGASLPAVFFILFILLSFLKSINKTPYTYFNFTGKKMSNVKNPIFEEVKKHFNEPVLYGTQLGRLIGYARDMHDQYHIVAYPGYPESKIIWHTAVGGYIFLDALKGQNVVNATNGEVWDDFFRMNNLLSCNNCPEVDEMIIEIKPDEE